MRFKHSCAYYTQCSLYYAVLIVYKYTAVRGKNLTTLADKQMREKQKGKKAKRQKGKKAKSKKLFSGTVDASLCRALCRLQARY